MATYRQVYTSFWQDPFVITLTPEEKYFYLYLITNTKTTICGIYELSMKIAEIETGYNRETVEKLLNKFEHDYQKVVYSSKTNEICIVNWFKYNVNKSPKVKLAIESSFNKVKNKDLIRYLYGIDTVSFATVYVTVSDSDNELSLNKEEEIKKEVIHEDIFKQYVNGNESLHESLKDFEKMRKSIKKPMTDRAKTMLLAELDKLAADGENITECLNQSIFHNWQGVFPVKKGENNGAVKKSDTERKPIYQYESIKL